MKLMIAVFDKLRDLVYSIDTRLLFLLIFLYQSGFIFTGIDFADQGWMATFYQQIFSEPESVKYNFSIWLTGLIGGAWLYVFPWLGLIGIRVLGVIMFTATLVLVYELLKNDFSKEALKMGLLLMTLLFGSHWAFAGFHYDNLSALLFVMMTLYLYRGLIENSNAKILLSGAILCLNVFARIPNLAGFGILLLVIYYGYSEKYSLRQYSRIVFIFCTGFIVSFISIILLMKIIQHDVFYWEILLDTIKKGNSEGSHGISASLVILLSQYYTMHIYIISGTAFLLIFLLATGKLRSRIFFILPFLIGVAIYFGIKENDFMRVSEWLMYHAFVLAVIISVFFTKKLSVKQKTLSFAGLLMFLILPLGCNYGFINMSGLVLFIALPIAAERFLHIQSFTGTFNNRQFLQANHQTLSIARKIIIVTILFSSVTFSAYYTYCEENGKYNLHHPVKNLKTGLIFTSEERALAINELLEESKKYIKPNDYILAYGNIPMIYFLTDTKPFLYNIWLGDYSLEYYSSLMNKSLYEKKNLPIIISSKVSTWGNWPRDVSEISLSGDNEWNNYFKSFIDENGYNLEWENNAFKLYVPNK